MTPVPPPNFLRLKIQCANGEIDETHTKVMDVMESLKFDLKLSEVLGSFDKSRLRLTSLSESEEKNTIYVHKVNHNKTKETI